MCRQVQRARPVAARAAGAVSRREACAAGLAAAAVLLAPPSAEAFLGFGEDAGKIYSEATVRPTCVWPLLCVSE